MFHRVSIKIREFKFKKRMAKQRFKKGYADCDCWGMHYWFAETFSKMIINLRDMKHGAPQQKFEEFDNLPLDWLIPELEKLEKIREKEDMEYDIYDIFDRWYIILTRIAYCLECTDDSTFEIENEFSEEYNKQVWGDDSDLTDKTWSFDKWWNKHHVVEKYDEKGKPKLYRLVTNEPDPELKEKFWNREEEIEKFREERKNEAFDLIKKYFYNLWD